MILSVNGLAFDYPSRPVLANISFSVCKGSFLAVLGVNGAGKSTLLKCINRVLQPKQGAVFIQNTATAALSRREIAQKIGYVAQRQEQTGATVFDMVLLGRKPYIHWEASAHDLQTVREALNVLELGQYALRYLNELSGGEQQKVIIARALAQEPDLLLLDEPTSNLDLKNQLEVIRVIKKIIENSHIGAVVSMHDLNLAIRFADEFILLKDGVIFAAGGMEVMTADNISRVYSTPVKITDVEGIPVVVPL